MPDLTTHTVAADMNISTLRRGYNEFELALGAQKREVGGEGFPWYPYGTLNNLVHLDNLLTGTNGNLANLIGELPVADVGAADGDLAFIWKRLAAQ